MDFFADLLIAAGAIGVAFFCFVLSRRLKALSRLDTGIGGAIAVLAQQVDDLTRALKAAQATARDSARQLESQTSRADAACRQLELLMASLHDLPPAEDRRAATGAPQRAEAGRRGADASAPEAGGDVATAAPLARWNTNRLTPEAATAPVATAAPAPRPRAIEPDQPPVKPARSRTVRRRQSVGARA